jgi:catechol 2,3-dioxygenase-like lactoylglutathione lyase family enzyme
LSEDPFLEIDHVQLAMPSGGEETARRFFVDVLGMTEIAKTTRIGQARWLLVCEW